MSILLLTGCKRDDNKLILATEAGFAPYEYYQDGEIVGVDIDIAREIAASLGKELVIKDVSFDFIINEIKSGKSLTDIFSVLFIAKLIFYVLSNGNTLK